MDYLKQSMAGSSGYRIRIHFALLQNVGGYTTVLMLKQDPFDAKNTRKI